jgi:hypothetical protein
MTLQLLHSEFLIYEENLFSFLSVCLLGLLKVLSRQKRRGDRNYNRIILNLHKIRIIFFSRYLKGSDLFNLAGQYL